MSDNGQANRDDEDAQAVSFRRLDNIVRALPETELASLIKRLGIRVDPQKRIDVAGQVARALVGMHEVRDPTRLPPACQELLHRAAEANGLLVVPSLPPGFEMLMGRGILFARRVASGFEIVLPFAYLVQLPTWQTEDPRSLRALVAQASFETMSAIASHYLSRPATPPIALALEAAWEVLTNSAQLEAEIERLPLLERRLLETIESLGGEVETAELLDLEREPLRLRGAKGVSTTRRGAGFALERRALLIPVHPNRHVIPSEVLAIVGRERRRELDERRQSVRGAVMAEDHMPRRAQFARDPSALALAIALGVREFAGEIKPNVGTPRSTIVRLAQRFGRSQTAVSVLCALSRALGLWEPTVQLGTTPPGSLTMAELSGQLFNVWLNGSAWDEVRAEPELLRASPDLRDASPSRALRDVVIDGLLDLGVEGWFAYTAFERYVLDDPRVQGCERLLRRWSERLGDTGALPTPEILRRIVLESLPVLGVVDIGGDSDPAMAAVASADDAVNDRVRNVSIRLTQRGRAYLGRRAGAVGSHERSRFIDNTVLRVGASSKVAQVMSLGAICEVGRVEDTIDLLLTPATVARAVSGGALTDEIRDRIEALAPLPDHISQVLVQASVVVGRGSLVACGAFLWVDDQDVRELLRTRKTTQDLFVDPSPPGGLLVAPGVDVERLTRRCRGVGVEIEVSENLTVRANRSLTPMPSEATSRSGTRAYRTSGTPGPMPRSRTPLPKLK